MATLILLPHRDIHLALNNADANTVEFSLNRYTGANGPFTLNDVTSNARTSFKMIAPHNAVGDRLEQFVTIDLAAGTISADAVGTNLVVFEFADQGDPTTVSYLTARIQVHEDILAWWFGNEKITTALDGVAHSQPSIYARFSDDDTGTDRTGDITGHGFVTLNSLAPARFSVDAVGRLQGISETPANDDAELEGSFLGVDRKINVKVVDYAKNRDIMVEVRAGDLATAAKRPNILFLAEGFTAAEEENFDKIVTHVADELFSKRRHEPFGTLKDSFNIFKAFTPSDDRLITCGFQVTDSKVSGLDKGSPIPFEHRVSVKGIFEIGELVAKVGLPKRGENRGRGALVTLWKSQGIDFDDDDTARIDDKLVEAWKNSHSGGFLEARDTFFGMMIGARWGDRDSEADEPALATPPDDDDSDALKALVQRAYEFYKKPVVARSIGFDPRRHPPTLYLRSNESRTTSFIRFLEGLRMKKAPNQALGSLWVPDGTFKPSRGLIAMIVNEQMDGGTSIGSGTLTANNLRSDISLKAEFEANANADIKVLRRVVPNKIRENLAETINTIAHEFGHSFKLGDEYEEFIRDKPDRNDDQDNIASMETIFADADFTKREIDPNKVKWRLLPRITLSAKLSAATQVANGKIEAMIDKGEAPAWQKARANSETAQLRRIVIEADGRQLPLSTADADHLADLTIDAIDASSGKITLSSSGPLAPPPNFPEGSSLFVPRRTAGGAVSTVMEQPVFDKIASTNAPLNKDNDTSKFKEPDFPVDIDNFEAPCQSATLIGVYEGAGRYSGLVYRPAGTCKMRTSGGEDENGEFCFVCKWLITNRVDPGKHHLVHSKFYPKRKKAEDNE